MGLGAVVGVLPVVTLNTQKGVTLTAVAGATASAAISAVLQVRQCPNWTPQLGLTPPGSSPPVSKHASQSQSTELVPVSPLWPPQRAMLTSAGYAASSQSQGVLAPIANVAGTIAGVAAVAKLSITPAGVSLVLCADVQAAVIAALRVRTTYPNTCLQLFTSDATCHGNVA